MKRVNIRVSDQMHEWYTNKSEQRGVTASSLMNEALDDYMKNDSQSAVQMSNISIASLTGWYQGYDIIKQDRFKIGSLAVYCARRNNGMTEELAYKIMQKHAEYQYFSKMEWFSLDESGLSELLEEFKSSGNLQNQKLIEALVSANSTEKMTLCQELFRYYKSSKFEPSDAFELMYQEMLSTK